MGIGAFQDDAFQFDAFQLDPVSSVTADALRNPLFANTTMADLLVTTDDPLLVTQTPAEPLFVSTDVPPYTVQ
jgi:hypothetical protein